MRALNGMLPGSISIHYRIMLSVYNVELGVRDYEDVAVNSS